MGAPEWADSRPAYESEASDSSSSSSSGPHSRSDSIESAARGGSASALIRPCTEADLPSIQAIYAHYVLHSTATFEETPPGVEYWQARYLEIHQAGLPFLVAVQDDRVVGYTYCSRWRPRPAYRRTVEDSVYVAHDMVGRGIGGLLMADLLAACAEAGMREIVAVVASGGQDASLALHRRFGFREVGTLRSVGFKFGGWLDTTLLQKSLIDDASEPSGDPA